MRRIQSGSPPYAYCVRRVSQQSVCIAAVYMLGSRTVPLVAQSKGNFAPKGLKVTL